MFLPPPPSVSAAVRGHGAVPRPHTFDDGQPLVSYIDTTLCFAARPRIVLTHVELFSAREVAPGSKIALTFYEAPRHAGDEPDHPLDALLLRPGKPWLPDGTGIFLYEQQLAVQPGEVGRRLLALQPPVLLAGRPVCCGFRFLEGPQLFIPFDVSGGSGSGRDARSTVDGRSAGNGFVWPSVLWAPGDSGARVACSTTTEFSPFTTPRAMSWAVHFEPATRPRSATDSGEQTVDDVESFSHALPPCGTFSNANAFGTGLLLPGHLAHEEVGVLDAAEAWPVASTLRASSWRLACKVAATDDDAFASFREATKRGEIGIISDPFQEAGPLTRECMLRELMEDERNCVAEGIGELLWRTAPKENSPISVVGRPPHVEVGGRRFPRDLLWPHIMLKWIAGRFGSLRSFDIIEIGAGFGALASLVLNTFALRSYSIVDLWEVQLLQRRFLASVGPPERFIGKLSFVGAGLPDNSRLLERYDLLISVCAFSELGATLQKRYFERLVLRSDRGLIVDNRYSAASASGRRLDMSFAGLTLLDRLLANGFHVEARTWQAALPSCETCSPLNLVIFYERRVAQPCHTTSPELWSAL